MAQYTLKDEQGTPSQEFPNQTTTKLRVATLIHDSQNSSLSGSLESQLSQYKSVSAGELGPSHISRIRPSTSFSNSSSQEGVFNSRLNAYEGAITYKKLQTTYAPATRSQQEASSLHMESTSAPKRMANGEIKSPGNSSPPSPVDAGQSGHSRNSSRTSRISQTGELSNQLRTRLSYAMVKIQHGWQSHSIKELEVMTSKQASPVSALSDQRGLYDSAVPKTMAANYSRSIQSPKRLATAPVYGNDALQKAKDAPVHEDSRLFNADALHEARQYQIGAAYESFWREHEGVSVSSQLKVRSPPNARPSLAPPVDLIPRNQRRPDALKRQLPALHTRNLYSADSQPKSELPNPPATPPPMNMAKMRTPSQQAAVEKDAVETLLFMSSPGNSGYHPPATLPRTPLRSEFGARASRTDQLGQKSLVSVPPPTPHSKRPLSDADIDKILDEMPDTSSDDEESQDQRPSQQSLES